MGIPVLTFVMIPVVSILIAFMAILLYRRKIQRIMGQLSTMLDHAINGGFSENVFDESAFSAVESKMARYLSSCTVSSEKLIVERNKIKSLISDISHQTKTPLANILLYSQLLNEYNLPEDCAICTKALSTQAEKLNFLVSALVKTSRLETGIITVTPKSDQISHIIHEVCQQIIPKAAVKGISVLAEDTDISACFDMKWTTEAVFNILDNAVKYTEIGGSISIKIISCELFCRMDFIDTGIGIAEEEHSKIFTRFYRSSAVSDQEGVGIGLYLAREIISAEGGYIKVTSRLGCGSTFSVFLPMS